MDIEGLRDIISTHIFEYSKDPYLLGISDSDIKIYKASEIPSAIHYSLQISPDLDCFSKKFVSDNLDTEDTKLKKKITTFIHGDKFVRFVKALSRSSYLESPYLSKLLRVCKSRMKNKDSNTDVEEIDILPLAVRSVSKMEQDYLRKFSK